MIKIQTQKAMRDSIYSELTEVKDIYGLNWITKSYKKMSLYILFVYSIIQTVKIL